MNGLAQPSITSAGPFPYVFYSKIPGIYTLDTSYNSYCAGTLNGQAVVNLLALPQPHLGPDINTCQGWSVVLDARPGFVNYLWNTGDNTPSIEMDKSGTYWVEVTSSNGCSNTDTIIVNFIPQPNPISIKHQ